jgi:hypothetical protein
MVSPERANNQRVPWTGLGLAAAALIACGCSAAVFGLCRHTARQTAGAMAGCMRNHVIRSAWNPIPSGVVAVLDRAGIDQLLHVQELEVPEHEFFEPDAAGLVSGSLFGFVGHLVGVRIITVVAEEPYDGPGDTIIVRAPYAAPFLFNLRGEWRPSCSICAVNLESCLDQEHEEHQERDRKNEVEDRLDLRTNAARHIAKMQTEPQQSAGADGEEKDVAGKSEMFFDAVVPGEPTCFRRLRPCDQRLHDQRQQHDHCDRMEDDLKG